MLKCGSKYCVFVCVAALESMGLHHCVGIRECVDCGLSMAFSWSIQHGAASSPVNY